MGEISLVRVDARNLAQEHICCAIGNDRENSARAAAKKAWFPIEAPRWLFAQCFWVSGSAAGKGLASRLLEAAEADARKCAGLCFLAAAKGKRPFLSDGRYLKKKGYDIADEALGFALFAKPSKSGLSMPRFTDSAREGKLPRRSRKRATRHAFTKSILPRPRTACALRRGSSRPTSMARS